MPKSSRYPITELPGTLQRSCREAQETFLSALDDAEVRETRRPLDCQRQSGGLRRVRESRSACCPQEEQRPADSAARIVTHVLGRARVPHVGTTPAGSGSVLSRSPGAGVCARQPGKLGRYERRYCKPCVSTALGHSVPPTVASVALSAG